MNDPSTRSTADPEVVARGDVSAGLVAYAKAKVLVAASHAHGPVLHTRIALTPRPRTRGGRNALARATVDVNGRPVRAHADAPTLREAVDLLEARLERRLEHSVRSRGRAASAAGARSRPLGRPSPRRTRTAPEPSAQERPGPKTVREAQVQTVDEAVYQMESSGDRFRLFTDAETGSDALVHRVDSHDYRLSQVDPQAVPVGPLAVPLTTGNDPAPRLDTAEAETRLAGSRRPFVFFADRHTGRGRVLYRRDDGGFGLITASGSAPLAEHPGSENEMSDTHDTRTAALEARVKELERQTTALASAIHTLVEALAANPARSPLTDEDAADAARLAHELLVAAGL